MSSTNEGKFVSVVAKAILGATFGYIAYRSVKARYGGGHCHGRKKHCGGAKRCGDSDADVEGGCRRKCGGGGGAAAGAGADAKECGAKGACGEKKHWPEPKVPKNVAVPGVARLPVFSSASVIGKTIFVSGVLGTKPTPTDGSAPSGPAVLVDGGLRAEVKQTMENISTILRGVMTGALPQGCALPPAFNVWAQVAKVNVYLRDTGAAPFSEMNDEYAKYFAAVPNPPARMTSAGVGLALGAAVEIEVIAKLPFRRRKHHGRGHGHGRGHFGGWKPFGHGGHCGFGGFGGQRKSHGACSGCGKVDGDEAPRQGCDGKGCSGGKPEAAPAAAAAAALAAPAAAAATGSAGAAAAGAATDEKQN